MVYLLLKLRVGMDNKNANLRESKNANREPIHPRLAPLKSRGAGGSLGGDENGITGFLQPVHSRRLHVPLQSVHS